MFAVQNTIEINAPVSQAWNKISKLDQVDQWLDGVNEAHFHTAHHEGVGAGRTCDIEGFGTLVETAVQWEDRKGFTLSIEGMPALVEQALGSWSLAPDGPDKTLATMTVEVSTRFGLLGKAAERLMLKPKFAKTVVGATESFKRYVEAR